MARFGGSEMRLAGSDPLSRFGECDHQIVGEDASAVSRQKRLVGDAAVAFGPEVNGAIRPRPRMCFRARKVYQDRRFGRVSHVRFAPHRRERIMNAKALPRKPKTCGNATTLPRPRCNAAGVFPKMLGTEQSFCNAIGRSALSAGA